MKEKKIWWCKEHEKVFFTSVKACCPTVERIGTLWEQNKPVKRARRGTGGSEQ